MQPNENVQPNVTPTQDPAPQPAPQAPAFQPGISNGYTAPTEPTQAQPTEPAQQPAAQPTQPTEPTAPQPTPTEPTQPAQPTQQPAQEPAAQPTETRQQLTYDEYLDSLTKDFQPVELPKPTDVDNSDPDGLVKFFDDYGNKLLERAQQEAQKQAIVQNAEREAWGKVFTKYPEIQNNPDLRDTIHNIRMGAYSRGQSLEPIQVADALVGSLHNEYKKGVNDSNVQTKVVDSQPLNGGGQPPVQAEVNYEALQNGGEQAAVMQLEALMRAGKL